MGLEDLCDQLKDADTWTRQSRNTTWTSQLPNGPFVESLPLRLMMDCLKRLAKSGTLTRSGFSMTIPSLGTVNKSQVFD